MRQVTEHLELILIKFASSGCINTMKIRVVVVVDPDRGVVKSRCLPKALVANGKLCQ
jgi:hypothetical protein